MSNYEIKLNDIQSYDIDGVVLTDRHIFKQYSRHGMLSVLNDTSTADVNIFKDLPITVDHEEMDTQNFRSIGTVKSAYRDGTKIKGNIRLFNPQARDIFKQCVGLSVGYNNGLNISGHQQHGNYGNEQYSHVFHSCKPKALSIISKVSGDVAIKTCRIRHDAGGEEVVIVFQPSQYKDLDTNIAHGIPGYNEYPNTIMSLDNPESNTQTSEQQELTNHEKTDADKFCVLEKQVMELANEMQGIRQDNQLSRDEIKANTTHIGSFHDKLDNINANHANLERHMVDLKHGTNKVYDTLNQLHEFTRGKPATANFVEPAEFPRHNPAEIQAPASDDNTSDTMAKDGKTDEVVENEHVSHSNTNIAPSNVDVFYTFEEKREQRRIARDRDFNTSRETKVLAKQYIN